MALRIYRLTAQPTVGTVGSASTQCIGAGRIVGVTGMIQAQAGAGSMTTIAELAINNTAVNNSYSSGISVPSEQLCDRLGLALANGTAGTATHFIATNVPVRQGTILCINSAFTGTAPAATNFCFDVQVQE